MQEKKMTGYPSIDKPWLKYYTEEAINTELPKCTMFEYLWRRNKDHLDDVAFTYFGTKWTYRRFFDELKRVAVALYKLGIKKGDIITIMSMHTPETIVCMYAINYLGAVCNMVYISHAEKELKEVIENTNSKMILVLDIDVSKVNSLAVNLTIPVVALRISDSMPFAVKAILKAKSAKIKLVDKVIKYKDLISNVEYNAMPPQSSDNTAVAIMVYTSGTTGEPKGVMLSNDNINAIVREVETTYTTPPRTQTYLNAIPPFLGFGVTMLHLAFCNGIEQIIILTANPDEIAEAVVKNKPNRIVYGPKLTEAIMRNVKGDMSYLIDFTGGGEEISVEKESKINEFLSTHGAKCKYTTGYGMSETTSAVSIQQNHIYKSGSIGIPLPAINAKVVDVETNEELTYGTIGELCYCTPSLMIGYYKNREATDSIIETDAQGNRWIHTGDLGYIDEDGFTYVKGRLKRIYTTFGKDGSMYKLFPQRIEEFLSGISQVKYCGCIVKEDAIRLHVALAFVELNGGKINRDETIKIINAELHSQLPDHLWPQSINIIESMPLTSSGKIDYRALEKEAEKL